MTCVAEEPQAGVGAGCVLQPWICLRDSLSPTGVGWTPCLKQWLKREKRNNICGAVWHYESKASKLLVHLDPVIPLL